MELELESVTEALDKMYSFAVQTFQRPPKNFKLGRQEFFKYVQEQKAYGRRVDNVEKFYFGGIQVIPVNEEGIAMTNPLDSSLM